MFLSRPFGSSSWSFALEDRTELPAIGEGVVAIGAEDFEHLLAGVDHCLADS